MSYYLNKNNLFYQKIFYGSKTIFLDFLALHFLLTLKLKLVNFISSSFGKMLKQPINYFSQTLAQMVPLGISQFWVPKSK